MLEFVLPSYVDFDIVVSRTVRQRVIKHSSRFEVAPVGSCPTISAVRGTCKSLTVKHRSACCDLRTRPATCRKSTRATSKQCQFWLCQQFRKTNIHQEVRYVAVHQHFFLHISKTWIKLCIQTFLTFRNADTCLSSFPAHFFAATETAPEKTVCHPHGSIVLQTVFLARTWPPPNVPQETCSGVSST